MSDRIGPRKVLPLKVEPLDEWGDGKLGQAMKFASTLRRQGASESQAAMYAARAFDLDAENVARALNWHGGVRTILRQGR